MQDQLQAYLAERGLGDVKISPPEPLTNGWETAIFAFTARGGAFGQARDLVVRIYTGGDVGGRPAAEAQALAWLHQAGYPVPELITFDAGSDLLGGPFLIMEQIRGKLLWQSCPAEEIRPRLCALMHRLHQVDAAAFPETAPSTFRLDVLRIMFDTAGLATAFDPVLEKLAVWERQVGREARCLIHGDFHPDNVLVAPDGRPYVIDWSCAALDDPRCDVAQAMVLELTNGHLQQVWMVREAYEAEVGEPVRDLEFFVALALARRLGTIAVAMVGGAHLLGMRPGLEAELRPHVGRLKELVMLLEAAAAVELPLVHAALDEVAGR